MLPRSALGDFVAAQDRPDPVDLLESQGRSRVSDLVPMRYARMLPRLQRLRRDAAGSLEWEVKRLVGVAIVAQENGFDRDERERILRACALA